MRRNILAIIALISILACGAKEITSLQELTNSAVVTIQRLPAEADSCGYLSYIPTDAETTNYKLMTTQADELSDNQLWVLYHQAVDDAYYLYNVAAERCVQVSTTDCDLSETATALDLDYCAEKGWLISGSDKMLGLSKGLRNAVYFLGDMDSSSYGIFYAIETADRELSEEEILTLESVVNNTRLAAIEEYRAFLTTAQTLNADGYSTYCGGYDVDDLAKALSDENVDNVSLPTLAALKAKAEESSYPSSTGYYRIKNYERPVANNHSNYMTLNKTGLTLFAQNSTTFGVSNQSNNGENLRLFQFSAVDGLDYDRRKIRVAAVDKGLKNGSKDFVVTFLDNDDASVFQLVRNAESSRLFKLQYNGENKRLTTNGVNGGQGIAINTVTENAMLWYIEKVESFTGPTLNAAGLAAMTLPCPVYTPQNCKAYFVASVAEGNITLGLFDDIIPAYVPFILKGTAASTPTFQIAETTPEGVIDNQLQGNTYYQSNEADIYTLAVDSNGEATFNLATDVTELSANSAYLPATAVTSEDSSATPASLSIDLDNVLVGVSSVTVDPAATIYYDLNGLRVTNPAKGQILIDASGNKILLR